MNLELLIKLSPLVVATLHGYGAAWLAVRMLFRPRYPVYLLGYKLPLTPGMLPKERERFIEALSTVIAERLLDVTTITEEILRLDLETEITSIAHREYLQHSQNEETIQTITDHLRERIYFLKDSVEARWEITRALRAIVEEEIGRRFSLIRRLVTDYFLDDESLYRIVGDAIEQLADRIAENLYVRTTISQVLTQIPESILKENSTSQSAAITTFISILGDRLDIRAVLMKRLGALSNEAIEQLVMDTAGREIKAIIWFGAGIGLIVGIIQTFINFI